MSDNRALAFVRANLSRDVMLAGDSSIPLQEEDIERKKFFDHIGALSQLMQMHDQMIGRGHGPNCLIQAHLSTACKMLHSVYLQAALKRGESSETVAMINDYVSQMFNEFNDKAMALADELEIP